MSTQRLTYEYLRKDCKRTLEFIYNVRNKFGQQARRLKFRFNFDLYKMDVPRVLLQHNIIVQYSNNIFVQFLFNL